MDQRILLVDDEPIFLRVVENQLQIAGFEQVRAITDSRQVIRTIREFKPNLIILDIWMPELDGLTVLESLCNYLIESELHVIVCTSQDSELTMQRAAFLGASDYLCKPVKPELLINRIKNVLRGKPNTKFILSGTGFSDTDPLA